MNALIQFDAPGGLGKQPSINPVSIGVGDILEWIRLHGRRLIEIDRWDDIGAEEYGRSFTAARTTQSNVVSDLYREFNRTVEGDQPSPESFADRVIPILKDKGWLNGDDGQLGQRTELIYNTNIRVAQSVSRWREIQQSKRLMPYLRYVGVADSRERLSHVLLNNITLAVDDPFWLRAFPPCGFRCRCTVIQYTRGQFERRKMQLTGSDEAMSRLERAMKLDPGFWAVNTGIASDLLVAQGVDSANANAIPGGVPMDAREMQQSGRNAWHALFYEVSKRLIGDQ